MLKDPKQYNRYAKVTNLGNICCEYLVGGMKI